MRYKILLILLATFFFNGLNNSREINDLAIVSAIGIDKVDEENFKVTAIVLNPKKQEGSGSSSNQTVIYESIDSTIQQAIRKMILESPRKLYLAHMELLLVSEKVAKEDLVDSLDFFIRDNEGSSDFLFVLARDIDASQILKVDSPTEEVLTDDIVESIKVTSKYLSITSENTLNNSIENILEEGEEMVMPSVRVVDLNLQNKDNNKKESSSSNKEQESSLSNVSSSKEENTSSNEKSEKIVVDTLAYFKNEKLQGYLSEEESSTYNILRNKYKGGVIKVEGEDSVIAEFISCNCILTPKYEHGKYILDINVKGVCNITEVGRKVKDVNKNMQEYETKVEQSLYTNIYKFINKCKYDYNADLIGFGKIFREKLNSEYKKVKDIFYDDIFNNIETNISIDIDFPNDGGINKKW